MKTFSRGLAGAMALTAAFASTDGWADNNWQYAELGYMVDGELDIDNDNLDGEGFRFEGAASMGEYAFARLVVDNPSYDPDNVIPTDYLQFRDQQMVSVGGHYPVELGGMTLDAFAEVGYERHAILGAAAYGFGYGAGARLFILPELELEARYRTADVEIDGLGSDEDSVDQTSFALRYGFRPEWAVGLHWAQSEYGSKLIGDEIETDTLSLTIRKVFGGEARGTQSDVEPLSYDYIQYGYLFSGDGDLEGGPSGVDIKGHEFRGSAGIGEYLLLSADARVLDWDGDDVSAAFIGSADDQVVSDLQFIALGAHTGFEAGVPMDAFFKVGLARNVYAGLPAEGFGYEVGLRMAPVERSEVAIRYLSASSETEMGGPNVDLDPEVLAVDVLYDVTGSGTSVAVGYFDSTLELSAMGSSEDIDAEGWTLGLRQAF